MSDPVNHPKHYTAHPSGVECIEIARLMSFDLGNAFKYLWRCALKGSALEDMKKALWYLTDFTERGFETTALRVNDVKWHAEEQLRDAWRKVEAVEREAIKNTDSPQDPLIIVMGMIVNAHLYMSKDFVWHARILLAECVERYPRK